MPEDDIINLSTSKNNKLNLSNNRESKSLDAKQMAMENAVIIFCRRGCSMSHVVKRLLQVHGVNPTVFEAMDAAMETQLITELNGLINDAKVDNYDQQGTVTTTTSLKDLNLPAVFVGGKLFGGVERVMATHITGDLVPILKDAGALWL